jgi:hypothetical protein
MACESEKELKRLKLFVPKHPFWMPCGKAYRLKPHNEKINCGEPCSRFVQHNLSRPSGRLKSKLNFV